jgi:protein-S-isoprenylcysteine O-methyltransferase Ste14
MRAVRQEARMVAVYYVMVIVFGVLGLAGVLRTVELLMAGSVQAMSAFYGFAFLMMAWKSFQKAREVKARSVRAESRTRERP